MGKVLPFVKVILNNTKSYKEYVYVGCNNPIIDLILNKTIFRLKCLHELLIDFSIHISVTCYRASTDNTRPPHITLPIFSQDLT